MGNSTVERTVSPYLRGAGERVEAPAGIRWWPLGAGNIRRMEDAGASAVVLQSLFEEQIELESFELDRFLSAAEEVGPESTTHFPDMLGYNRGPDAYLKHIRKVKEAVRIPVIASLNGTSVDGGPPNSPATRWSRNTAIWCAR